MRTWTRSGSNLASAIAILLAITSARSEVAPGRLTGAATNIVISYRLDPWLLSGNYGSQFWASPPVLGPGTQGSTFTVQTRADALRQENPTAVNPTWISADTNMVTVTPGQGRQVAITVKRSGQTRLDVRARGLRKTLVIKAEAHLANNLLVTITQRE